MQTLPVMKDVSNFVGTVFITKRPNKSMTPPKWYLLILKSTKNSGIFFRRVYYNNSTLKTGKINI